MTLPSTMINLTPKVFYTLTVVVIIVIVCLICYCFMKRRTEPSKSRAKLRSRITYIGTFILLIALVQIWVDGFAHFFTVLSIVAAGLLVSNKETIMNLVGWLIINWRGVFTEGDCVQIQGFTGYVETIRPLYFKLYETVSLERRRATGKVIKVPNGLIITSPVTTFTPESYIILQQHQFQVDLDSDCQQAVQSVQQLLEQILTEHYQHDGRYTKAALSKRSKALASLVSFEPYVTLKLNTEKTGWIISASYHCFATDIKAIEMAFWLGVQQSQQVILNHDVKNMLAVGAKG